MSTSIRPEVSKKNEYWIDRHRYYELKHFCLQYRLWKKAAASFDGISKAPVGVSVKTSEVSDPTARCALMRASYIKRMEMVERAAAETDPVIGDYIFKGVTTGVSYDYLNTMFGVPCGKREYYELYRKFFYRLDELRG